MLVSLGYLYWVSYNCLIFLDETNTDTKAVRGDVQTYGRMYIQRYEQRKFSRVLWDIIPWSRLIQVKEEVRDMVRGRCERRIGGLEVGRVGRSEKDVSRLNRGKGAVWTGSRNV